VSISTEALTTSYNSAILAYTGSFLRVSNISLYWGEYGCLLNGFVVPSCDQERTPFGERQRLIKQVIAYQSSFYLPRIHSPGDKTVQWFAIRLLGSPGLGLSVWRVAFVHGGRSHDGVVKGYVMERV
jgi:hypothetical protein